MEGQQNTSLGELNEVINAFAHIAAGGFIGGGDSIEGYIIEGLHLHYPGRPQIERIAEAFKDSNNRLYEGWKAAGYLFFQVFNEMNDVAFDCANEILSFVQSAQENENKSVTAIENAIEAGNSILNELGLNDNR